MTISELIRILDLRTNITVYTDTGFTGYKAYELLNNEEDFMFIKIKDMSLNFSNELEILL